MKNKVDLESLYLKLPITLQNLVVSLEGWRIKRRRYDADFEKQFSETLTDGRRQGDYLKELQAKRLGRALRVARTTPFWNDVFNRHGVDLKEKDPFYSLAKLPIINKSDVKQDIDALTNSSFSPKEIVVCHTSGTTGGGLVFPVTRSAEQIQWATWWRYRNWHHICFNTWCGYFGGRSIVPLKQTRPPFWRINRPGRQVMFSAYHLSPHTISAYIDALNYYKIPWLHGYPSTLAYLAGLKVDNNLPELIYLQVITTGAESLLPQQKTLLNKAFKVPVREHYGQAEGVANISECPQGSLHVDEDFSYVEFIPVKKGSDLYRIIGTNWANAAFPLIRYDTGDTVTLSDKSCPCGNPGRVVLQIDGRKEDYVVLPSGAKIGRLDHIFKDMTTVLAAQIYQPNLTIIVLRIVKGDNFERTRDEKAILVETRKRLGDGIDIKIEYLSDLPRTTSGKLRFVVSDIIENKLI